MSISKHLSAQTRPTFLHWLRARSYRASSARLAVCRPWSRRRGWGPSACSLGRWTWSSWCPEPPTICSDWLRCRTCSCRLRRSAWTPNRSTFARHRWSALNHTALATAFRHSKQGSCCMLSREPATVSQHSSCKQQLFDVHLLSRPTSANTNQQQAACKSSLQCQQPTEFMQQTTSMLQQAINWNTELDSDKVRISCRQSRYQHQTCMKPRQTLMFAQTKTM